MCALGGVGGALFIVYFYGTYGKYWGECALGDVGGASLNILYGTYVKF